MSHVGNGSDDFRDLERSTLPPDVLEQVKQARIEARSIIDRLEPRHINGWPSLIAILKDCLENAERHVKIHQRIEGLKREVI